MKLTGIRKRFGRFTAVDDVSLSIEPGEIVGLIGENGAGKTTLMRIAAGELIADHGSIERNGIVELVHQHFLLVDEFTIAENLALSAHDTPFLLREREVTESAERAIAATGIELRDVRRPVSTLSAGERSKLELIKAIARRPAMLILDEPTSVLTPGESEELFAVVRRLAAAGTSIVFISHKLPEVLAVAQRVVVMRAGRIVHGRASMTASELAEAMAGERSAIPGEQDQASVAAPSSGRPLLTIDELEVWRGEIVAIAGVAGNGQNELAERIRTFRGSGVIGAIPEDRTRDGLVAEMSIAENLALRNRRWNRRAAGRQAEELISKYSIRARGPEQRAGSLSGGNQQKVLLARELERKPDLLLASEPSRGLDLQSTAFVHDQLRRAAAHGMAIVLISSDLDEVFALATAIQVIYRGRLSERMTPREASERVAQLMAGVT